MQDTRRRVLGEHPVKITLACLYLKIVFLSRKIDILGIASVTGYTRLNTKF